MQTRCGGPVKKLEPHQAAKSPAPTNPCPSNPSPAETWQIDVILSASPSGLANRQSSREGSSTCSHWLSDMATLQTTHHLASIFLHKAGMNGRLGGARVGQKLVTPPFLHG